MQDLSFLFANWTEFHTKLLHLLLRYSFQRNKRKSKTKRRKTENNLVIYVCVCLRVLTRVNWKLHQIVIFDSLRNVWRHKSLYACTHCIYHCRYTMHMSHADDDCSVCLSIAILYNKQHSTVPLPFRSNQCAKWMTTTPTTSATTIKIVSIRCNKSCKSQQMESIKMCVYKAVAVLQREKKSGKNSEK